MILDYDAIILDDTLRPVDDFTLGDRTAQSIRPSLCSRSSRVLVGIRFHHRSNLPGGLGQRAYQLAGGR
jgi:hypothetical protein